MKALAAKKAIIFFFFLLVSCLALAWATSFFQAGRIILALLSLFLPGLVFSYLIIPSSSDFSRGHNLEILERIILSFIFSLCLIPLLIFLASEIGFEVNLINSATLVFIFTLIISVILFFKKRGKKINVRFS